MLQKLSLSNKLLNYSKKNNPEFRILNRRLIFEETLLQDERTRIFF